MEVLTLDVRGNPRFFPPALSERDERAFTRTISDLTFRENVNLVKAPAELEARRGERVIIWSGTLADDWTFRHPTTWGPAGLERLRAAVATVGSEAARGGFEVLLRPHARHVLCDVQRCVRLLHEWREWPVGLALDAAALMEPSMLGEAEDHFRRAYETLGPLARAVFVANVAAPGDEDGPVRAVPLGEGAVGSERIVELLERNVGRDIPRIVLGEVDARRIAGPGPGR